MNNKIIAFIVAMLICAQGLAEESKWMEVFSATKGKITCLETEEKTGIVYIGAQERLYRTVDCGKSWKEVNLPAGISEVKDIAIGKQSLFIVAQGGVYISNDFGYTWKLLPGKKNVSGITIFSQDKNNETLLAWAEKDLYQIIGNDWQKLGPAFLKADITDVACRNGVIFVSSAGDVYYSANVGESWDKLFLLSEYDNET